MAQRIQSTFSPRQGTDAVARRARLLFALRPRHPRRLRQPPWPTYLRNLLGGIHESRPGFFPKTRRSLLPDALSKQVAGRISRQNSAHGIAGMAPRRWL